MVRAMIGLSCRLRPPPGSQTPFGNEGAAVLALLLALLGATPAGADPVLPPALRKVGFDQKLNEQLPLELAFNDESGRRVRLAEYFHGKPVILVLAYYRCPMLCSQVLNGLVRCLLDIPFNAGREFEVVVVSFDPKEKPELAADKKKTYMDRYGRPGAAGGWHFLTGGEESIRRLTDAAGFRYRYDEANKQYAHASGIVVLTPAGKVYRYFFGIRFQPRDLRLTLVEASENKIGTVYDTVMFYCFQYDPVQGRYGAAIMNILRASGALTVVALAAIFGVVWRREWRARHKPATGG